MKRLLGLLLFILASASPAWATKITVPQQTVTNWQRTTTAPIIRVFANQTFTASTNEIIYKGSPDDGNYYLSITCSIVGSTVTIPTFVIDSTTDGLDVRTTRYNFYWYDSNGNLLVPVDGMSNIQVPNVIASSSGCTPAGTCGIFSDIRVYNAGSPRLDRTDFYDKFQVDQKVLALNPTTTKGDLVTHDLSSSIRLPVGTDGQVLQADSTQPSGLRWVTGGGGVSTVFGRSGDVVAAPNDYTWAQIDKTISSLADITTRSATDLTSGTLPDARFPATLPILSGANLTNLNASNLASGTVPDGRFPATLPALSGVNLTNLNASNLASGTVPLGRLSGITNTEISATAGIVDTKLATISTAGKVSDSALSSNIPLKNAASNVLTGDLTVSGLLKLGTTPVTINDAAGKILSASLNTVQVAQGGTGVTALSDVSGTTNQVTVTGGTARVIGGTVTISLPQNIHTGATPQFSALGLGGASGSASTLKIYGTTSGSITFAVPATAGANTITFPAGTTNFSTTGGANQVVKQSSAGAALTVAQLGFSELSGTASLAQGGTGSSLSDPAANKIVAWDDTDNTVGFWTLGSGLSYDHATHTLSAPTGGSGTVTNTGTLTSGQLIKGNGGVDITVGNLTGDVTTSGSMATTISAGVVTYSKIQNVSVTNRFLGRITAGAGSTEELTGTQATTLLDVFTSTLKGLAPASGGGTTTFLRADGTWATPAGSGTVTNTGTLTAGQLIKGNGGSDITVGNLTGDVTTSGSMATTIASGAVTYSKIQNVSATSRFLGRITAGAGSTEELTGTQATTLLDTFTSTLKGLVPSSGGGTTNFLRADGTWAAPPGGGGGATTALDNLASVAINTSLLPGTDNSIDLGSATKQWRNGYFSDFVEFAHTKGIRVANGSSLKILEGTGGGTGSIVMSASNLVLQTALVTSFDIQNGLGFARAVKIDTATTSTPVAFGIDHNLSGGTAAAGFGAALKYTLQSTTTTAQDAASIAAVWTDATHSSRTADLVFSTVNNATALAEAGRFTGAGNFKVTGTIAAGSGPTTLTSSAGKLLIAALDATGTPSSTTFLRGDGTWSTPSGAGTVTNTGTLTANAVIIGNGTTDVTALASLGTSGQVLTSNGAGSPPSFQNATGGGSPGGSGSEIQYRGGASTFSPVTSSSVSGGQVTWADKQTVALDNANSGASDNVLDLRHSTSGTPSVGLGASIRFGLETSTTLNQDAARISTYWTDVTDATRTSKLGIETVDAAGGLTETFSIAGNGLTTHTLVDAATTVPTNLVVLRHNSTATVGKEFGAGILFQNQTTTTQNRDTGKIVAGWTDEADATRTGEIRFFTVSSGGALTERAWFDNRGLAFGTDAFITLSEHSSAPSTPATGSNALYTKTDDRLYLKDGTGAETKFVGLTTTDTLTNKTLTSPVISSISNTGTLTLPTSTDTLVGRATTDTLTNKTVDPEGTGNVIGFLGKIWIDAGGGTAAAPASNWDLPASNTPVAAVVEGGTNGVLQGVLDFADGATDLTAQRTWLLPSDWTGAVDVKFRWFSSTTSGNVIWGVATACVADGETNDPTFNSFSDAAADATKGTANQLNDASVTGITTTGCAAGESMHLKIARRLSQAGDTMAGTARLTGVEITYRRNQ